MRGLRIGRWFGVNIGIDWSLFLIFWLVAVNLGAGVLPAWHPGWSTATRWVVAVSAAILFFASVLVHEMSHALVARAHGLEVRSITLFMFGGVTNIEHEPPTPAAELLTAIVGPVTSFALGLLCLLAGGWLGHLRGAAPDLERALHDLGPLPTILFWLGPINILLSLFNLIPGFPLDGGRVLRALLWTATGDLEPATRWAARVGQGCGFVLIGLGVTMAFGMRVPWFGTGFGSGIWLALIGWFLSSAAAASYEQLVIGRLLEDVPVWRLMQRAPTSVPPSLPVSRLVDDYLMRSDQRAFPVVVEERLAGLVCLEDVRKTSRDRWDSTSAGEIMTPAEALAVIGPNADVSEALRELSRRDVEQLPVVQDGRFLGVLRRRDIMKWIELHSDQRAFHHPRPSH